MPHFFMQLLIHNALKILWEYHSLASIEDSTLLINIKLMPFGQ